MPPRDSYFYTWDDDLFTKDQAIYELFIDVTRGLVKGDVLDIGCGSRVYYDTSSVHRWVGMDLSTQLLDQVEFLSKVNPKGPIEKIHGSCEEIDFPDESFDTVCSVFLLHHLGRNTGKESQLVVGDVLKQVHRILRPGGVFIVFESWPLALLHIYGLMYSFLYPLARSLLRIELPYFFTSKQLTSIAQEAGFTRVHAMSADVYEDNVWPVLKLRVPHWVQPLFHKYGIYLLVK